MYEAVKAEREKASSRVRAIHSQLVCGLALRLRVLCGIEWRAGSQHAAPPDRVDTAAGVNGGKNAKAEARSRGGCNVHAVNARPCSAKRHRGYRERQVQAR